MADLPKDVQEFRKRTVPLLLAKRHEEAFTECATLIAGAGKGASVPPDALVDAHIMQATLYAMRDDYQNSLISLHKANELDARRKFKFIACYIASCIKTAKALRVLRAINAAVSQLQETLFHAPSASERIAHYTQLRVLKNLAQSKPFRLYNVGYMNDPEEGETFLKIVKEMSGQNIRKSLYSGKGKDSYSPAYVGSFVRVNEKEGERENGDLFLWRTYGKNQGEDGAGACIHFDASGLSENPSDLLSQMLPNETDESQDCLYRVAYERQVVPGKKLHSDLNQLSALLRHAVKSDWKSEKDGVYKVVREMLDQIRFLFKSDHYSAEEELRIVQSHYTDKNGRLIADGAVQTDIDSSPPRFFVEVKNLPLETVILGPVARRFWGWEQWLKQQNSALEVRKSKIPYGERD